VRVLPIDLPTALRLVSAANPTIRLARERVREAYARQQQAQVLWLPNLWVGGNPYAPTFLPNFYHHDGNTQNQRGEVFEVVRSNAAFSAGVTMEFDLGEAIFAPLVARRLTAAQAAQARTVTNDVQLDVALTYLELLRAYGELAVNAETLANSERMVKIGQQVQDAGFGKTPGDLNRLRAELELRKQEKTDFEGHAAVASARLAQLLLVDPTLDLRPLDASILPIALVPTAGNLDDLVGVGLLNRPELAESRALVAAALARWRQARTAPLIPSLQVMYFGGVFGGGTPGLRDFAGRDDFLAQASWQLHNAGLGDLYRSREGRARYNEANLHVLEIEAQVGAEVTAAAKSARARERSLADAEEGVRQAEEMWRRVLRWTTEVGFRVRRFEALELLTAEQALNQARKQYLTAVIEYNKAEFRLYAAMGHPSLEALPCATALPERGSPLPPPGAQTTKEQEPKGK
jgi:outer membrane protein TolC